MTEDRSVLTRPAQSPDEVVAYGKGTEQVADVRFGHSGASGKPLVLILHGGYWRPAYDRAHAAPMAESLAAAGWTVAAAEYRRIPGEPDAMLEDVRCAVETLPEVVDRHDGRFVMIGHSAGGQLALWAASALPTPRLCGVLALAPVADLELACQWSLGDGAVTAFLGTPPIQRPDVDPKRLPSPATRIEIVHGVQDSVVPLAISESYAARHTETRLSHVQNCGHFQLIDPLSAAWPIVLKTLQRLSDDDI